MENAVQVKDEVLMAQELLQSKEKEDTNSFLQEYQELSKKYNLGFSPVITFKGSGPELSLEVIKSN